MALSSCIKYPGTEVYSMDRPSAEVHAPSAAGTVASMENAKAFMTEKFSYLAR